MARPAFREVFPRELFLSKRILIDEHAPQSCDFFLMELIKEFSFSIFHYDCDSESFCKMLSSMNTETTVNSIYTSDEQSADIIDGIQTRRLLYSTPPPGHVHVFRANTAVIQDYYDYTLIVRIENLKSGYTSRVDGLISLFHRDTVYKSVRYKIHKDFIEYFDDK